MPESPLDVQARYYDERVQDLQDMLMETIALNAQIVSELWTTIDVLRAMVSKDAPARVAEEA